MLRKRFCPFHDHRFIACLANGVTSQHEDESTREGTDAGNIAISNNRHGNSIHVILRF